jgi:hypothetical protein
LTAAPLLRVRNEHATWQATFHISSACIRAYP